ncbi:MAG: hypothetical protein R2729_21145 [Bryobacteraceae bacterium]
MLRFTGRVPAAILLASCAITAGAQEIKVGSVVHLNQILGSDEPRNLYLDTQGRVKDQPAFKQNKQLATSIFVFTNFKQDRDKGSGSWKVHCPGKADGAAIAYGDKIKLENMYPGTGFLYDVNYFERGIYGDIFKRRGREMDDHAVFTQPMSPFFATDWVVGGGPGVKKGAVVKAGDSITLESLGHGRLDSAVNDASVGFGYFLRAGIPAEELAMFKSYNTQELVFTSRFSFVRGFPEDMSFWTISLK